ncbi:MAG: hypothetical protein ABEI77_08390 [Halorientalis sp.]
MARFSSPRAVSFAAAETMLLFAHPPPGEPVVGLEAGSLGLCSVLSVQIAELPAGQAADPLDAVLAALAPLSGVAQGFRGSCLGSLSLTGASLWEPAALVVAVRDAAESLRVFGLGLLVLVRPGLLSVRSSVGGPGLLSLVVSRLSLSLLLMLLVALLLMLLSMLLSRGLVMCLLGLRRIVSEPCLGVL